MQMQNNVKAGNGFATPGPDLPSVQKRAREETGWNLVPVTATVFSSFKYQTARWLFILTLAKERDFNETAFSLFFKLGDFKV